MKSAEGLARREMRHLVTAGLAAALLWSVPACGSGGSSTANDRAATSVTSADAASPGSTTTPEGGGQHATTAALAEPTQAELERMLPDASDLGPDYRIDADDDADDGGSLSQEIARACPDSVLALHTRDHSKRRAKRNFVTDDQRVIQVSVGPVSEAGSAFATKSGFEASVATLNNCDTVRYTQGSLDFAVEFRATSLDRGDYGAKVDLSFTISSDDLPEPLDVQGEGIVFRVGATVVYLFASGGVDPNDLSVRDPDSGIIDHLATNFEQQLSSR